MKHLTLIISLATTTLFLLLSTTTTTATEMANVYDVYGDPLVAGGEYYVVPYKNNPVGGGFSWKDHRKILFPFCVEVYVNQVEDNLKFGELTAFYPTDRKSSNKITVSTDVNIVFPEVTPPGSFSFLCDSPSNVWKVESGEKVMLGGKKDKKDSKSVFKIEELETGGYGIYFCNGNKKISSCQGLSVDSTSDDRRLVVNATADPIPVVFESEEYFLKKHAATRFAS